MEILEMILCIRFGANDTESSSEVIASSTVVSSRVMTHFGVSVLLTSVRRFADDFFFFF